MRKDLVDAATEHDVAPYEKRQYARLTHQSESLPCLPNDVGVMPLEIVRPRLHVAKCSIASYSIDMSKTIPQRDLRNENAKVIDAVAAGETFIVTRNGEPVAELRPVRQARRTFITRDEVASLAAAAVRIDHRKFRADLDQPIEQGL